MGMTNSFHSSTKNHAISGASKLGGVQKHNARGYFSFEYNGEKIHAIIGVPQNIVSDVQEYINEKFQPAIDEYNEKQKRKDRKITKSPFEYFCENKNLDIANEVVFQIGDKNFWSAVRIENKRKRKNKEVVLKDFPDEVKAVMDEIYLRQAKAYETIYETDSEEILKRVEEDYSSSKQFLNQLEPSELEEFKKLEKKKQQDRDLVFKSFSEDKLERFERYLSSCSTIDFVERKKLPERIRTGAITIKLTNLTTHYDEFSPHAHGISVCSVKGFETGVNERIAKSVVLNKWSLSVLQDKMHEIALEEMAKHPDLFTVPLEEKQPGREYQYTVLEYKAKREKEKISILENKIDDLTNQYEALETVSPIKTEAEYKAIGESATAEVTEIEAMVADLNEQFNFVEYRYGSSQAAFDEIKWIFQKDFLPNFLQLVESVKEKIVNLAIFETIKNIKDKFSIVLSQRIAKTKKDVADVESIISGAEERSVQTDKGQPAEIEQEKN